MASILKKSLPFTAWCLTLCLGSGIGFGTARALAEGGAAPQATPQFPPDQGPDQSPPQQDSPQNFQDEQQPAPPPPPDEGPDAGTGAPQDGATYAPQGPEQSPENLARVSFVQGDVKLMSQGQTDFQQAVANMPLIANSSLQTGEDGEAEVEFADGSVARITPNSALALGQIGPDSVTLQQNSGLVYYELNVGQGHPAFRVDFPNAEVVPAANVIFRMDLDNAPEIAVMTGSAQVSGNGFSAANVAEGQTMRLEPANGAPYSVAQGITSNSWDQWNQDRDQAISEEAAQQTPVRNQVGDTGDENWNDLDAYGNWYPVNGENVWVPGGVSTGWDPFGYGYWGYYPGFGYTYISGYPWGWLPYHCGLWSYYPFGWGWSPGGCGSIWYPVVGIHGYRGYIRPGRPALGPGLHTAPLVRVDRGPAARGPWGAGHPLPAIDRDAALHFGGHEITPLTRAPFHAQGGIGNRGTSPGVRQALGGGGGQDRFTQGQAPAVGQQRGQDRAPGEVQPRANPAGNPEYHPSPNPEYHHGSNFGSNPRSTYTPRTTPTPHYSSPPRGAQPSYHFSAPRGGGGRR